MDLKKIFYICLIVFLALFFSGCQEDTKDTNYQIPDNVLFESDIVELVFADITEHKSNGVVNQLDVAFLLKNIAGRSLNINKSVEFYNEADELLYTSDPVQFKGFSAGYIEQEPNPIIEYNGKNASAVSYVKIIVEELKL